MQAWSLGPYVIAAIAIAVVLALVLASLRSRAEKRSTPNRAAPSSSVDPFYLDSSHAGEPRTEEGRGR